MEEGIRQRGWSQAGVAALWIGSPNVSGFETAVEGGSGGTMKNQLHGENIWVVVVGYWLMIGGEQRSQGLLGLARWRGSKIAWWAGDIAFSRL